MPFLSRLTFSWRYAIRIAGILFALLLLYIGGVLLYGTLTDWRPPAELPVPAERTAAAAVPADTTLSFLIWNIGYGGLGAESDFFFDSGNLLTSAGHMVRSPRELAEKNLTGILDFLGQTRSDFYLLQEVDERARRSFGVNQFARAADRLPGYYAAFIPNYRSRFVPIPLLQPWAAYGPVESGLATYSRFQPEAAVRYQLPGAFGWPTRLFQLDRCLAVHRYRVGEGRELVVVNAHLSAHDSDGSLKRQEMAFLKEFCLREYEQGNYVIVGGDWNQAPPNFRFDAFSPGRTEGYFQFNIEPDFLPADWRWLYDPRTPTNRKTRRPYQPGVTSTTVIDFFLVSPNVEAKLVKTLDLGFRFSDHQPVYLEVKWLRKPEGLSKPTDN